MIQQYNFTTIQYLKKIVIFIEFEFTILICDNFDVHNYTLY